MIKCKYPRQFMFCFIKEWEYSKNNLVYRVIVAETIISVISVNRTHSMVQFFLNFLCHSIFKDGQILNKKFRFKPHFNKLLIIFIFHDLLSQWFIGDDVLRFPERLLIATLTNFTVITYSCQTNYFFNE